MRTNRTHMCTGCGEEIPLSQDICDGCHDTLIQEIEDYEAMLEYDLDLYDLGD